MGMKYEDFGQSKLIECWRKLVGYEREDGGTVSGKGKLTKLYSLVTRFKVMNDEVRICDRLNPNDRNYKELSRVMEAVAKRELARVDHARAIKPLDDMFLGADANRKSGGLNSVTGKDGKAKGKGKDKGKGKESPAWTGDQK